MALQEGQFLELEKRLISFKAQFGVTNTGKGQLSQEAFGKSYNIYPEDILLEGNKIPFDASNSVLQPDLVKPARIRTWVPSSDSNITDIHEKINRGHFETTETGFTENPFIEQIICPLTRVTGTGGQFYIAYGLESQSAATYDIDYKSNDSIDGGKLFSRIKADQASKKQSNILTNFINPAKFGGAYAVKVFGSDTRIEDNGLTYPVSPGQTSGIEAFESDFVGGQQNYENSTTANSNYYRPKIENSLETPFGVVEGGEFPSNGSPSIYEGWVFDYKGGTFLIGVSAGIEGGTEGENPEDDANITDTWSHPLWLVGYRYIGPTGFSHPEANLTASNVQINNDLNVDGAITLEGLNFINVESSAITSSTTFGNNVSGSIHKFTGSVFITGGLFVDGESTAGGGGGQSGINPFVFPTAYSHSSVYGHYNKTTIEPTDENDVIEFTSSFGLKVSGSIQSDNFLALLGASAISQISQSIRKSVGDVTSFQSHILSSTPVPEGYNGLENTIFGSGSAGGFLFNYYTAVNGRDYPVLSSYAPFKSKLSGSTHHKFMFPEPISIGKIGVHYSNNSVNIFDPEISFLGDGTGDSTRPGIDTVELLGSVDGITYVQLYVSNSIKDAGQTVLEATSTTYTAGTDFELSINDYNSGESALYYNNLVAFNQKQIAHHTSSIIESTSSIDGSLKKYKYFELKVSGGLKVEDDPNSYRHYLHNISIWENKNQSPNNRKHLTIGFDDTQDPNKPEGTTIFDSAIATSIDKLGITNVATFPEDFVFSTINANNITSQNATITSTLTSDNIINSSLINVSNKVDITGTSGITFENDGFSKFNKSIYLVDSPNLNDGFSSIQRSIVLDSLNPIYFTNVKGDGTPGTDTFSGRIFGHYNSNGATDLYIDAHRIYNVSDQEIRLISLADDGIISMTASKVNVEHNLIVAGNIDFATITQNGIPFSGGGGSGFPHNQATTQITASIAGALKIETGNNITNPHIILNPVADENLDIHNKNLLTSNILHNYGGTLYWGNEPLGTGEDATTIIDGGELSSNFNINNFDIIGNGNINILGTGSFGHLLFSASSTPSHSSNLHSLVYDESTNQVYYTGSYGAGGSGADDDWTVSLLSNAINTPYVLSERNVKVTGSIDTSTTYKIGTEDVLSVSNGSNLKLASPKFSSFQVEFDQPVLTVSKSGKVGIFNTTPTEGLVVEGNISSSGTIFAKKLSPKSTTNIVTYNKDDGQFHITSSTAFSGDNNTVTDIVEDSTITVDPSGVPYIFSDPNSNSIKIQRDNGTTSTGFPSTPTPDVTSNSSSLIDNVLPPEFFIIYPNNLNGTTQKAANIIFNFKKPVVISEFRQKFGYEENNYYLPTNVKIYGKNSEFLGSDLDEGILLTQGARPSIAGVYDQDEEGNGNLGNSGGEFNHSEPWISYNTKRTSSIPETSLTSSFQYYRIRYSGSFSHTSTKNFSGVFIDKITPISRSFTQGTTISFNNGVINGPQIITNNLIGTASYALYSEISDYATNGFPFSGSAVISGSLNVNGNTNLQNLSLEGDLNLNNYSINNVSTLETNNITAANINTSIINTSTTNTDVLNVGNFPISQPNNQGINTTGPINVSSIIPTNFTEPYDGLVSLSLGRAGANIGLLQTPSSGQNTDTRTLTPLNFTFTGDSSHSIIDDNLNTNIIVNQNTLGTTLVFTGDENFSYPNYGLYDGSYSEPFQELIQTSSFYIKLRFPEPVLIEEFRFNFPTTTSDILEYNYLENSMSLDGTRLFTNGTQQTIGFDGSYITDLYGYDSDIDNINDTPASFWGDSNHWFISPKLGVLVDDPTTNFLYVGTNDSPWEPNSILSTFTSNTGLPANHRGVGLGFEGYFQNPYLDDPEIDLNDPEAGLHLGYDFGEGNETIIHKYRLYQYKNNMISDMVFEACNDTSSGDWTLVDVNMNITTYENVINGLYTTIQTFEPQHSLNPITTRDNSNFQNTTPFRFYRFRFLGGDTTFFKIEFFEAETITDGVTSGFNPEYVSIYSNENQGSSGFSNSQHYLGSGLFKGTTTISQTDTKITASLTDFNSNNGYPLSKLYTIEFSGSHNPFNFAGVSEIQPVTRSFATQSLTLGPDIEYPNLPEGHPQGVDCSNANAVYYNESTGTFYYTSSCGGTSTNTSNTFDEVITNTITSPTTGIIFDSPSVFKHEVNVEKDLIVRGRILGEFGHDLSLGDPHKPIKDIHMDRGTIFFYSGSTVDSSSVEQARLTVNSTTKEIEFKSGSELTSLRAKEINLGLDTSGIQGPVQISSNADGNQGFIAVSAKPGGVGSTILRAENASASGSEFGMGNITQKGSGSFAILLDADQVRGDAKFLIESNTAVATAGPRLFSVSESGETRAYNHFKADTYISTINVTASNNISASAEGIFGSIQISTNESNANRIHFGTPTGNNGFIYDDTSDLQIGYNNTNILSISDNGNQNVKINGNLKTTSHITSSGNISGSLITTASFGSLQLSNLPTSPTGLPTGSVWVSGSQNDSSTSNVNCGTLRIVI